MQRVVISHCYCDHVMTHGTQWLSPSEIHTGKVNRGPRASLIDFVVQSFPRTVFSRSPVPRMPIKAGMPPLILSKGGEYGMDPHQSRKTQGWVVY